MTFEWDENKNEINIAKHGISFETAKTVFYDENAILFDDRNIRNLKKIYLLGMLRRCMCCVSLL